MLQIPLGAAQVSGTNANDTSYIVNATSNRVRVTALRILPKTAVVTDGSNYITTDVKKGATTIATHTTNSTGGSALTAGTVKDLTITGTGTDIELAPGDVLTVAVTKTGTGPTYSHQVVATVQDIRG